MSIDREQQLEALVRELADELAGYLDQEYHARDRYPDLMRRWLRDTEIIVRARSLAPVRWRCDACGLTSDEPFDRCEQCGVPDQCYELQE